MCMIYVDTEYVKGIVHPTMVILSPFTHYHVTSNLYDFEHKRRYFQENTGSYFPGNIQLMGTGAFKIQQHKSS